MKLERYRVGAIIHAGPPDGNDLTLCGYTLSGDDPDAPDDLAELTERGKINCTDCLNIIRYSKAIPARLLAR